MRFGCFCVFFLFFGKRPIEKWISARHAHRAINAFRRTGERERTRCLCFVLQHQFLQPSHMRHFVRRCFLVAAFLIPSDRIRLRGMPIFIRFCSLRLSLRPAVRLFPSHLAAAGTAASYARLISLGSRKIGSKTALATGRRNGNRTKAIVCVHFMAYFCIFRSMLPFSSFAISYIPFPPPAYGSPRSARPAAAQLDDRKRRNMQNRKTEHRKTNKTENQITQKIWHYGIDIMFISFLYEFFPIWKTVRCVSHGAPARSVDGKRWFLPFC